MEYFSITLRMFLHTGIKLCSKNECFYCQTAPSSRKMNMQLQHIKDDVLKICKIHESWLMYYDYCIKK